MTRARTRRRSMLVSAGVGAMGALLILALLLVPQPGGSPSELHVAGPGASSSASLSDSSKSLESPQPTDALGRTIEEPSEGAPTAPEVAVPTTTAEPLTTAPTTDADSTTAPESSPDTSEAPSETTTVDATSTTQTSTTAPSTTESPTTTIGSSTRIESSCGSLTVRLEGSGIQLESTDANPGFEVDVKKTGPDEIEVSFEGEGDPHCEITAENRDGQVWSDVENDEE